MSGRPAAGADVVVRDQSGGSHRARMVDVTAERFVLEFSAGADATFHQRDRILVTWPEPVGLICLPAVLLEQSLEQPAVWLADVAGDPWPEQRRQYPRAAVSGTVGLRPRLRPDLPAATGVLLDLSEVGLRCAVEQDYLKFAVPATAIDIELALDVGALTLTGKVLSGRPTASAEHRHEFVVVFDRPVRQLEALRDLIHRSQLA
jgi:hypothetical protein